MKCETCGAHHDPSGLDEFVAATSHNPGADVDALAVMHEAAS